MSTLMLPEGEAWLMMTILSFHNNKKKREILVKTTNLDLAPCSPTVCLYFEACTMFNRANDLPSFWSHDKPKWHHTVPCGFEQMSDQDFWALEM